MIYLSQKDHLKNTFFLRVLKEPDQKAIELDDDKPFRFSPDKGGFLPSGESLDLLEVWVKPINKLFPSVLFSAKPIQPHVSSSSKKIKIKIINTLTGQIQEETDFTYEKAPVENHMDNWS